MKKILLFYIFPFILFSCNKEENIPTSINYPSEQKSINLTVDGNVRRFVIYLPSGYNNAGKMPMIFALHGGGGSPEQMLSQIDFRTIAERDKIVLVYPEAFQEKWNDGRPTPANLLGIDDVNFFNQMCDYMIANYPVESSKIFATGISNGGFMTSRLGCELSNRIAAIAVDAATIEQTNIYPNCNPSNPLPAIYIHGTLDYFVPFNGGIMTVGEGGTVISHFQAITKWVEINNCETNPIITNLPDISNDGTTVVERKYSNVSNGNEVISYVISNGGHTWPQGVQSLPISLVGLTSQDMNANEVIWQFFKRHSQQ
ncbi:hypothetical protein KIH23_08335 [Flavobacterium sp. CYK-55]|uniref:alpha/beta hydrolase family esterase n=1 Tax=Flavobacterium sp. CYK-55 TaxID=2835529 RepID=UPI001BD1736F|nr:PHB depolymerase family esterase [Flavobacterium sp. CYK-55]MBS7787304.1 hypothetical protein [Flavobacterium sp. CYK-55]